MKKVEGGGICSPSTQEMKSRGVGNSRLSSATERDEGHPRLYEIIYLSI